MLRPENSPDPSLVFGHYVMIAHDSGVTAFINLINTISAFPPDRTSLTLLYFVEDIVLSVSHRTTSYSRTSFCSTWKKAAST